MRPSNILDVQLSQEHML